MLDVVFESGATQEDWEAKNEENWCRSEEKLNKVATEISEWPKKKSPSIHCLLPLVPAGGSTYGRDSRVIPVDFSGGFDIYNPLAKELDIGVLKKSHEQWFHSHSQQRWNDIRFIATVPSEVRMFLRDRDKSMPFAFDPNTHYLLS